MTSYPLRELTAVDLRLVLKIEPELQVAAAKLGRPEQPIRHEPFDKFVELVEATRELREVLDNHHLNARDFFRTVDATILALQGAANVIPAEGKVMRANVALVTNPPEDIAAALIEWRRARLGF